MALIEINWRPGRKILRQFGLIGAAAFGLLGLGAWLWHRLLVFSISDSAAGTAAGALWIASATCAVLAILWPSGLKSLYVGLSLVGLPIGWVVSHILLGAVYYLVLTPIGLIMRALGKDPLQRSFEPGAKTYWMPRQTVVDPKRYYRQS